MVSWLTVLISCFVLLLAVEGISLSKNAHIATQRHRKRHPKISTSEVDNTGTSTKRPLSRTGNKNLANSENKNSLDTEEIVLREITRQVPILRGNMLTSQLGAVGQGSMVAAENAYKITKTAMKASFDLLAGKHVTLFDIAGTWTAQQEVLLSDGTTQPTPVTFRLFENKTVVTVFRGKEYSSKYTFQERSWPRHCTIHFDARGFQGPSDKDVVELTYKGYFKKSILNSRVLLMRGTMQRSYGKFFWRGVKTVGDFKASKRRYGR